jgi:pyruvate ferredoxin oxidoreductase alpha subunit
MTRALLTGNAAAAWGARLAGVDYVPAFPITPQTEIIETLAKWIDNDEIRGRLVTLESEHSMITAAGAAAATGVRVFSATSSQGLLYGMEMLYTVAGWRAPFVLVNVSRGLSAPLTLESDHNDIMAARDSGFLQIHCATCQEVLDSILIAYRLAEDSRVRLPVLVNLDGFYLSFTREPVEIPDARAAAGFVGDFDPQSTRFRASSPESQAVAVLGGTPYSYFRYQTHLAARNGLAVHDEVSAGFREAFGRDYPAVEAYRADDADFVFFMLGSFATKAREAVDRLRDAGQPVGLLRPRLLRPFPEETLLSALYGQPEAPPIVASFIGGLGGRDISAEEFYEIVQTLRTAADTGRTPAPRLLYTQNELREMRKLQAIAHVEREELDNDRP